MPKKWRVNREDIFRGHGGAGGRAEEMPQNGEPK